MELKQRTGLLNSYVSRIAPEAFDTVPDLVKRTRSSDIPENLIFSGMEKLSTGRELTRAQQITIEKVIHKQYRPAALVIDNTFSELAFPWGGLGEGEIRNRIEAAILQVGRVEVPQRPGAPPYAGTAFRVGADLLMTNRHVAEIFTTGVGVNNIRFRTSWSAGINFRKEIVPTPEIPDLEVTEIIMMHPLWDMALLRVAGLPDTNPLALSTTHPDDLVGKNIVVIGYPALDHINDTDVQNQIFGGMFGVKRLQPGKINERRVIESYGNEVNALTHDSSTLAGNSGSLLLDVDTGEAIGIHFGGVYLDSNFAVPTFELANDSIVVDAGINFSNVISDNADLDPAWIMVGSESESTVPPVETSTTVRDAMSTEIPAPTSISPPSGEVSMTIPLHIKISLGHPEARANAADNSISNDGSEGWLSGNNQNNENIAKRALRLSDQAHLGKHRPNHLAGLTCASLSQLAYSNASRSTEIKVKNLGFDTCDFVDVEDTQCFIASNTRLVVLAFRGSEANLGDWIGNLRAYQVTRSYGSVHSGFLYAFSVAKNKIRRELNQVNAKHKKIVLTGHSLGGALALIAAAEWKNSYPTSEIYTYGQPAVGGNSFKSNTQYLTDKYVRYVYKNDIVSRMLPLYKHTKRKTMLPLSLSESFDDSYIDNSEILSESEFLSIQEKLLNPTQEEFIFDPLTDHRMTNYLNELTKIASS